MTKVILTTTVIFLFVSNINAQYIQPREIDLVKHIPYISAGYDFNLISINMGYNYFFSQIKSTSFIEITQNTALLGFDNFRSQIGWRTWVGSYRVFSLISSASFEYIRSTNKAGIYDGIGSIIETNPGLLIARLNFGANLYCNPILLTHIQHTDYYHEYFYSNAKDGWYKFTSTTWRAGLFIAALPTKNRNSEVSLKGGYQTSGQYDKIIPGFYFLLGINTRLQ